jgi:hypothetical protein
MECCSTATKSLLSNSKQNPASNTGGIFICQ